MPQPKVNPEHFRYLILDTAHPSFNGRRNAARARSAEVVPDNILSVVMSDDGLQALIKIPGADSAWVADNGWSQVENAPNGILRIFTRFTHHELIDLLATDANWSNTRTP